MTAREPAEPCGRVVVEARRTQEGHRVSIGEAPEWHLREEGRRGRRQRPGGRRCIPTGEHELHAVSQPGHVALNEVLVRPTRQQR